MKEEASQGQKSPVPGGLPAHSLPNSWPQMKSSAWRTITEFSLVFPPFSPPIPQHPTLSQLHSYRNQATSWYFSHYPSLTMLWIRCPALWASLDGGRPLPRTFPPFFSTRHNTGRCHKMFTLKMPPMAPPGKHKSSRSPAPENLHPGGFLPTDHTFVNFSLGNAPPSP